MQVTVLKIIYFIITIFKYKQKDENPPFSVCQTGQTLPIVCRGSIDGKRKWNQTRQKKQRCGKTVLNVKLNWTARMVVFFVPNAAGEFVLRRR